MKARHGLMAIALIIAAWLALFGDKTPSGQIAEPMQRKGAANAANTSNKDKVTHNDSTKTDPIILQLQARHPTLADDPAAMREIRIAPAPVTSGGLFAVQSWTPPPPPPVPPPPAPPPPPPPPPMAPALPFTYLGKKMEDGRWEVYLAMGEQTVIAREKEQIDSSYRVESIQPPNMTLMYLPLKQTQTLTIGEASQ